MEKISEIKPEYYDRIQEETMPGILYISKMYEVAIHRCACGCGGESVTSLRPGEWVLTENGDKVTLSPSISNRGCNAHYFIRGNKIEWA
jgi:hypothetical protein